MKLKNNDQEVFETFINRYNLSSLQADQFLQYLDLLLSWNKKINLTSITTIADVIHYHFDDSLRITEFYDFNAIKGIADIGTGGGFPGIPLKIMFPHIPVILIEVIQKKAAFLQTIIDDLNLENIEVSILDWRTFLRTTDYDIDLFTARASLQPEELIRAFSPVSPYNNATLIYWASALWQAKDPKVEQYVAKEETYFIDHKVRKYIFFKK